MVDVFSQESLQAQNEILSMPLLLAELASEGIAQVELKTFDHV